MSLLLVLVISCQIQAIAQAKDELRQGRPYAALDSLLTAEELGAEGQTLQFLIRKAIREIKASGNRTEEV